MADPRWPRSYPAEPSTATAAEEWDTATWSPVAGQAAYDLPDGKTARAGDPAARLQWGPILFVPGVDYVLQSTRVVMTSPPAADQAAAGAPLVLAFRRA